MITAEQEAPAYDLSGLDDHWLRHPAFGSTFASAVIDRWCGYFDEAERNGLLGRWTKSHAVYHGLRGGSTVRLNVRGEQGEFTELEVNQFRTLLKTVLAIGTSGRPSFNAVPTTNDYAASQSVRLVEDAIDYFKSVKRSEQRLRVQAEMSLVHGMAFLHQRWDANRDQGQGDVVEDVLTVFDVAYETGTEIEHAGWWIVRAWVNKYDLAALFPEKAKEVLAGGEEPSKVLRWHTASLGRLSEDEDDRVPVFYVYAARSPSVPEGRAATVVGDTVLMDGPLPYDEVPVLAMQPSSFLGSSEGYADGWDVLGCQDLHSGALSALASRLVHFATPNITAEEGAEVGVEDFGGFKMLRHKPGTQPPAVLELFEVPPSLFACLDLVKGLMQSALGVNSVVSGQDQSGVKSGAHAALMQAMAIQFQSGFQSAWGHLLERWATGLVRLLKRFGQSGRVVQLAGKQGRHRAIELSAESFGAIDSVRIDLGNPLSRTVAGRYDIAKDLLTAGMVQRPEQFINAIATGRLDPITEGPSGEIELVKAENEALVEGEPVWVLDTDNHLLHAQEHRVLLNSPHARADQGLVSRVAQHLTEHLEKWRALTATDPDLLAISGCPPAPSPPPVPGMAPPGAEMGPPGPPPEVPQPPPANGSGGPTEAPAPRAQVETPMGSISNLPRLPREPEPPRVEG